MKKELLFSMLAVSALSVHAQRQMETLDRGLVAVKTASGVFTSWRIDGTEYYDTQYNLYRDGTRVNQEPLEVSNFTDPAGTESSTYTVRAVVRGEEQEACEPAKVWNRQYLEVPMGKVYSRRGTDITKDYSLNDATAADLDGDGEMDYVVNRLSTSNALDCYVEGYLRTGEHLWTVRLGPNELSCAGQDDMILAYDMDGDGKSEVVVQTSDGTQFWDPQARTFAQTHFGLEVDAPEKLATYEDASFDVITLWHVMEHLEHLNETWETLSRILQDRGILVIAVPNPSSFDARKYGAMWAAWDVPRHLWHFTPSAMQQFGAKHGFVLAERHPMPFDAFYVSMLTEKYKQSRSPFFKGLLIGFEAWMATLTRKEQSSSMIYVFRKKQL